MGKKYYIPANSNTVKWGYYNKNIPPILKIDPGDVVTIEVLTHHAGDAYDLMIKGDKNMEEIYEWTNIKKTINRRGMGDINDKSIGPGKGHGVHLITGPVYINGAKPGDILKVEILDIYPRPSPNKNKYYGSNLAASWGYQYGDLINKHSPKKEVVSIYNVLPSKKIANPYYNYVWKPQIDSSGIYHKSYNYPGIIVKNKTIRKNYKINNKLNIKLRPHFGILGVTPNYNNMVSSIPPSIFGGNIDNWRAGKYSSIYLPVQVDGANFIVGDSHASQGDSELSGTAIEFSMTGKFRFTLIKKNENPFGLNSPIIETPTEWIIQGFSYPDYLKEFGKQSQELIGKKSSIDAAMRDAYRKTNIFLTKYMKLSEDEAISIMSVAVDFGITQIVDMNYGVHAIIRKNIFKNSNNFNKYKNRKYVTKKIKIRKYKK